MDQLLKEWKMEALQHLLLEDVLHNLKCYQSSKLKVELLPALRRRKQLPWNQLYRGHLPQPIMNHSPYSFFFELICTFTESFSYLHRKQISMWSTPVIKSLYIFHSWIDQFHFFLHLHSWIHGFQDILSFQAMN